LNFWPVCDTVEAKIVEGEIMQIHESAEDYLEAILKLKEKKGIVRSIDIVNELGYSKPSISIAMKHLRENGFILMDLEGYITLTDSGMAIASRIYGRHKTLTRILVSLGVDAETAEADACRVEHDLSEESFEKIRGYAEKCKKETEK
jgi:Mn-dependent DtxR family transcriptional regulator